MFQFLMLSREFFFMQNISDLARVKVHPFCERPSQVRTLLYPVSSVWVLRQDDHHRNPNINNKCVLHRFTSSFTSFHPLLKTGPLTRAIPSIIIFFKINIFLIRDLKNLSCQRHEKNTFCHQRPETEQFIAQHHL